MVLLRWPLALLRPRGLAPYCSLAHNVVKSPYGSVDIPDVPLHEYVWRHVDRYADKDAIECVISGRRYSYGEARTAARSFAAALSRAGFGPRDRALLVLPNCAEFPLVLLGASEAGLAVSTANPLYTAEELNHQLKTCQPRVVVTTPGLLSASVDRAIQLSGRPVDLVVTVPAPEFGATGDGGGGAGGVAADFLQLVDRARGDAPPELRGWSPSDTALMPFSSGTTGLPKGVCLTHRNLVASFETANHPALKVVDFPSKDHQDVLPLVIPMFHLLGLSYVMLHKMALGAKIVSMPRFEPAIFLESLQKHRATALYVVPPILLFLGNHPQVKRHHLETLKVVHSAAAPIGQKDAERVLERGPPNLQINQGYGMTETGPLPINVERINKKVTSVGRPVPDTMAKVVDVESGLTLGPNQPGELWLKGPQIMKGYYNNPQATAETIDSEGWLHTGDIAYYDQDLDFYIIDRIKELIKVKGFQVPPAELEELLRSHPDISDAAVVGIPDERCGELPRAYIVPNKKGSNVTITPEDVAKFVSTKVADHKQLAGGVFFIDEIPKNPSGKILRRILRERSTK